MDGKMLGSLGPCPSFFHLSEHPGAFVACTVGASRIMCQDVCVLTNLSPSKAICVSKQLCTGLRRTGAHYTAQLKFPHDFPLKVGVLIIQVCVLLSNFYGNVISWKSAFLVEDCQFHGICSLN